jgi:AAT family amino acid transporter/GABA permease
MFLVMRMLAEMAAANPHALSFADHARLGLGEWAGFVCGWLYWYFWVVVVGIEAIAGAVILRTWIPSLEVWQIGLGLMVLLTATNLLSTRSYGEFEFWFASIKVGAIIAFVVVAGSYALGLTSPTGPTLDNLVAHGGFAPFGPAAVLAGVTGIVFSMTGAEIATVVAAESSEPSRAIAALTTSLIVRILLFYVLSVLCILAVVPWNTIEPGSSPFAVALESMGVPFAATIMNLIVLVAVLSCLNSGLYITSRMLFGLAAHGDAPRSLVALDARLVPTRAILIGTVFGYLAVLASVVSPQRLFTFLVNASGAIMLVIYLLIALAQVRRRRVVDRGGGPPLAIRMWLYPWLSYATVSAIALVLASMLFRPAERAQLAASALSVVVVLGAFWWKRRSRA